jgi:hypothetical protein
MVARVNMKRNEVLDEHGHTNGVLTRPILFLNVTAEFAPGSSGAPIADEAGNVVGQVASIAEAGEPEIGGDQRSPVTQCAGALLHGDGRNPAPDPAEHSGRPGTGDHQRSRCPAQVAGAALKHGLALL